VLNLRGLDGPLSRSRLSEVYRALGALTGLIQLELMHEGVNAPSEVSGLSALTRLTFLSVSAKEPSPELLAALEGLTSLGNLSLFVEDFHPLPVSCFEELSSSRLFFEFYTSFFTLLTPL
jgi:hypothetical protein